MWHGGEILMVRRHGMGPASTGAAARSPSSHRSHEETDRDLLHRREQEFRTLVENAPDIIERFDSRFRMLYVNPALEHFTGLPREGFLNKTKRELGMPAPLCELWETKLAEVFSAGREVAFEFEYLAPRGLMYLQARVVPETDPEGGIVSAMSIVRDITAQKLAEIGMRDARDEARRAEAQMLKSKEDVEAASRAKDDFLAVLSHELRTPLSPVLTAAQMMAKDATLSAEQRDSVELIARNVELETRLIEDLLDLTRISRGKIELHLGTVDLHGALLEVIEICREELRAKELKLILDIKAVQHHVRADTARLKQVFWNLVKNAIKFTPRGGTITVSTAAAGECVTMTVQDSGVGIAPESLPHIFAAFEQGGKDITRRFGGMGLGLTISRSLVEMHGGTLTARSDGLGRGASFTIGLPLVAPPPAGAGHAVPAKLRRRASRLKNLRVLLVEDHADTAKVMAALLRSYGCEVHIASSLAGAREIGANQEFDVLVSDIGLPDGSGIDLMRELSSRYDILGIALSGYGMEEDVRRSKGAGFAAHLTKPVDLSLLERTLYEVAGGGAGSKPTQA